MAISRTAANSAASFMLRKVPATIITTISINSMIMRVRFSLSFIDSPSFQTDLGLIGTQSMISNQSSSCWFLKQVHAKDELFACFQIYRVFGTTSSNILLRLR